MLLVFGIRRTQVKGPVQRELNCPACGAGEHATFGVLRYAHLFWIPVAPYGGKVSTECLRCKKTMAGEELPDRTRLEIDRKVFTTLRTLPYFTGLILVGLVVVAIGLSGRR